MRVRVRVSGTGSVRARYPEPLTLTTAHSIKFKDVVEDIINSEVKYPNSIKSILNKENKSQSIEDYDELKEILLNRV